MGTMTITQNQIPDSRFSAMGAALGQAHARNNGDVDLSNRIISKIFEYVNKMGFFRQIGGLPQNSMSIKDYFRHTPAAGYESPLGVFSNLGEGLCGFGNTFAAITDTIPGTARKLSKEWNASVLLDQVEHKDRFGSEIESAKQEISSELCIAWAQFVNQFCYGLLGIAQTMHGTLNFIWSLYET